MDKLNRRQFLKKSAVTIAVTSTCVCHLSACSTITKVGNAPEIRPESYTFAENVLTIDLGKNTNLSQIGGAVKVKHPGIPGGIIIAHVEDRRFEIASLLCTHRGVEVEYDPAQMMFICSSLGSSAFTLDGANVSGPAETPLKNYEGVLDEGILMIRM